MTRAAQAIINLQAFQDNLRRVREFAPSSKVMAIIKANGYGHGIIRVARALDAVDAFGVASIDEALGLRNAGIKQPIVLLEGFFEASELSDISALQLSAVIHHESQVTLLEQASLPLPLTAWLKVDSGMHRLGFRPEQVEKAYQRLSECPNVAEPVRWMTHFANADFRNDQLIDQQISVFNKVVAGFDGARSLANSAALMSRPQSVAGGQWVRPGIMLYGVSPFADSVAENEGLKAVMTLSSKLIAVNDCRKGDAIGYGGIFTCHEDMPVGVVAIGYGDGYPRSATQGTPVLLNGSRVPLIGQVSMDMICVDLRTQPEARVGDTAVMWGQGLPVEEIARHAGTIPYELLCGITQRVRIVEG